jgi:UDP-N-acetylmuramate dehydrogenase
MNAGAHGQDFRAAVRSVELVRADGTAEVRMAETIPWSYRSSGLGHVVVTEATLVLEPGERRRLRREISEHFRWRKAGTPFNEPCCGSGFRNPAPTSEDKRTAGQWIDAAGLKGFRIGGAEVSTQHANYIVNVGDASSTDVRRVIDAVRAKVLETLGVDLEVEVRIIEE